MTTSVDRQHYLENNIHRDIREDKWTGKPIYLSRSFYQAAEPTETSLECGEYVVLMEKNGSGWWCVNSKAGKGWVPSHYLANPNKLADLPTKSRTKKQVVNINTALHPSAFQEHNGGENKMIDCVNKNKPRDKRETENASHSVTCVKDLRKMFE